MIKFLLFLSLFLFIYYSRKKIKKEKLFNNELHIYNLIDIGLSKLQVDKVVGVKGEWFSTRYQYWIDNKPDYEVYIWKLDNIAFSCCFLYGELVSKKLLSVSIN